MRNAINAIEEKCELHSKVSKGRNKLPRKDVGDGSDEELDNNALVVEVPPKSEDDSLSSSSPDYSDY